MTVKVAAILLAAGESKRMGDQNKLALDFHGQTMFSKVLAEIEKSDIDELVIVTNKENLCLFDERMVRMDRVVLNPYFKAGMTTSIQCGLRSISHDIDGYMICMADQPLMSSIEYNKIIDQFKKVFQSDSNCLVVPFYNEKRGNPVIFSRNYRKPILSHKKMNGCKHLIQDNLQHRVVIQMESNAAIRDVDTMNDYAGIND